MCNKLQTHLTQSSYIVPKIRYAVLIFNVMEN